jgi:hypothetical protein
MAKINWVVDDETTPGAPAPMVAITGISAPKAKDAKPASDPWTREQLSAGKSTMVYYGFPDASINDDSLGFSRRFEMSAVGGDNVDFINKNFIAKKRELDFDADRKLAKNQARIEFWSFTGKKIDVIGLKEQQLLNPAPFAAKLKDVVAKNREISNGEIKRMQDELDRRKKEALDAAVK